MKGYFFRHVICGMILLSCGTQQSDVTIDLNTKPIAAAGANGTGSTSTMVPLDARNSFDPDGDALTYHWSFHHVPINSRYSDSEEDAFSHNHSKIATSSFLPDVEGTYIVDLIVKDAQGTASDVDSVVFNIQGGLLPIANAGEDQTVNVGEIFELSANNSFDPFGRELSYNWSLVRVPSTSSITEIENSTNESISLKPDTAGLYVVSLIVNNNVYTSLPDIVSIHARSTTPESPVADAGDDQEAEYCRDVQLNGLNSSDVNNDALSYHWSVVLQPESSTAGPSSFSDISDPEAIFVGDKEGTYSLALYVSDGELWSDPDFVNVTLTDRVSNVAPQIAPGNNSFGINAGTSECQEPLPGECLHTCDECPPTTIHLGEELSINDIDGDVLHYRWTVVSGSCTDVQYTTKEDCENANRNWTPNAVMNDPDELFSDVTVQLAAPSAPNHCATEKFSFELEATDCPGATDTKIVTYELSCCGNSTDGPQSNGNTCCYDIAMTDSWGDGWNGASLDLSVNGSFFESYSFSSGSVGSGQACVTDGSIMEFSWNSGTYDSEVSFTITNPSGSVVFNQGPNPMVGLLYCDTASCP